MRLSGIRDGDIVQVDDGLPYFAIVRGRDRRRLLVKPVAGKFTPKPVKASEVVGHWRLARRRNGSP